MAQVPDLSGQSRHDSAQIVRGMAAGTRILTLDGELPVEYLAPGDRVLTRAGSRRITRVEVTVIRNARMVCIRADALGVGRPQEDVRVSAAQEILVRDWRARALFGAAQAMVPAARLCDGEYMRQDIVLMARLFTLVLETAEVIYAGGLELACDGVRVTA